MDRQIQKLKLLVERYMYFSKADLLKTLGKPNKKSDDFTWFYIRRRWGVFKEERIFIFHQDKVVDICILQYIAGIEFRNMFYYENQDPEYRTIRLL